jgi:hypothetical protein
MQKKFTTRNLQLETNPKFADDDKYTSFVNMGGGTVKLMFFGPNKSEDYWHFRVQVHEDQWVEAFPKFMQIGIGFAKEDNGNTNLPSSCSATEIFQHIKRNKRYASIPDSVCLKAIRMLQQAAKEYQAFERMLEAQEVCRFEPLLVNKDQTDYISHAEFKENSVIKRAGRKTTFRRNFDGSTYEKTAYSIYFGEVAGGLYKYKVKVYAINQKRAIQRTVDVIKHLAATGEKKVLKRNDFTGEAGAFRVASKVDDMFIGLI